MQWLSPLLSARRIVAALKGRAALSAAALIAAAAVAVMVALVSGPLSSGAVQNASVSIDMITTGNTYTPGADANEDGFPDPGTNHMTVGSIDNCLTTAAPGNNLMHNHPVHLVIQNVEDVVAWYGALQLHRRRDAAIDLQRYALYRQLYRRRGRLRQPAHRRQQPPRRNPRQHHSAAATDRTSDRPHRRRLPWCPELRRLPRHAAKGCPRRAESDLWHNGRRYPRHANAAGESGQRRQAVPLHESR